MRGFKHAIGALSMLLAIPAAGESAFAHGGTYRGPAGEVPPDSRQPGDPPPPESGGGTPTPVPPDGGGGTPTPEGGGGTPTPGGGGGTPTPEPGEGGSVPQPPTPGSGGTRTPGRMPSKKGPSYESWLFWWNYNKDEIVSLRRRLRAGLARSAEGIGVMGGSGPGGDASERQDVTRNRVERDIAPLFERYARDRKVHFDIQASGVIGLAKIGRVEALPLLMEIARNADDSYHHTVEETACLSLGILQHRAPAVRRFLADRASDATARVRSRCFAMFALGLLGEADAAAGSQAEALRALGAIAGRGGESNREITCSALVAIGLLGDPAAVPDLLRWLHEERIGENALQDLQLSFVAAALGKIGRPGLSGPGSREVLDALRDRLKRRDRATRWSAVIALGQVAPQADERLQRLCAGWLADVVRSDGRSGADSQTVHFAIASLGRIAGAPSAPEAVREQAIRVIGGALRDGRSTTRSFAALALGIAGMDLDESSRRHLADPIRGQFGKIGGDAEQRGAHALALGLLGDIQSAGALRDLVQDGGQDPQLRGIAALALGLLQERGAIGPIQRALRDGSAERLRVDAAVGLGLLQDGGAVEILVDILKVERNSAAVLGSAAQALGQIGDQRAVGPLGEMLKDEKGQYPGALTRALAAVALAQIGDRSDVPVLARLSKDVNYRAYYNALGEVLTIL